MNLLFLTMRWWYQVDLQERAEVEMKEGLEFELKIANITRPKASS